jgi:putative glutamine amidotransferase
VRPLIAVTGRPTSAGKPWRTEGVGSPANYLEAVERAGAIPAVLQPTDPPEGSESVEAFMAERLAPFAGLLLTGGADVDPVHYHERPHPAFDGTAPIVDRFELGLCRAALTAQLPVLAICRGLQVLNVACGGSLDQHLGDHPGGDDHGVSGGPSGRSTVTIEPDAALAAIVGSGEIVSCCSHHQAIDRLGGGLVVTARSADGVIEAVELARPAPSWLIAVQWHPEKVAAAEHDHQAIFDAFVDAAAATTLGGAPDRACDPASDRTQRRPSRADGVMTS